MAPGKPPSFGDAVKRACFGPFPGQPCPYRALVTTTRCHACRLALGRARPGTTARGYGTTHQTARRELARTLPRYCAYGCGRWLTGTDRWVAAHVVDGDPRSGYVVSCVSCNQRAKARVASRSL